MKNKNVVWVIVALVIILGIVWWATKNQKNLWSPILPDDSAQLTSVLYSDGSSKVEALFNNSNNTVTFSQDGGEAITLPIAISASGVRYTNSDESLVFWEHQDELTISRDGENVFVGLIVSSDDYPSILNTWIWEKTVDNNEELVFPLEESSFSITFNEEGQVSGTTDCNNFFGSYELKDNNGLSFGPLASTKMFCENSQENIFTAWLAEADSYSFSSPENLAINLSDGSSLYFRK